MQNTKYDPQGPKVTYACNAGYWVAWQGPQAIWEDIDEHSLLRKLREMGIHDAQYTPLRIVRVV